MNRLRLLFHCLLIVAAVNTNAQNPQLKKIWETDSTLKVPESVLYYAAEKILFVSNIDGKSDQKDLKGSISKISTEGKIIDDAWASNLSAPKGMGIYQGMLFVTDLAEVVTIDLKTGKVARRLPIEGAVFLNDLTIDKSGVVYVSDSRTGKVHSIKNNVASVHLENKNGVNGLLSVNDDLYMAVKDTLYKVDKAKSLKVITTGMDESSDGIVMVDGSNFLVSCWNGVIYYVNANGSKTILMDNRVEKSNTADIGFDPANNILFVPTFFKNQVIAYKFSMN